LVNSGTASKQEIQGSPKWFQANEISLHTAQWRISLKL
jgi:hypothetical protein